MIEITNGSLVAKVDEQLGGEITFFGHANRNLLAFYDWQSPVSAKVSSSYGDPLLDFLSSYKGGWQVLFPNAGNPAEVNGVSLPFHGETCRTRMNVVIQDSGKLVLTTGTRLPFVLTRTYEIPEGRDVLLVEQTVTNESDLTLPFIWGEHPAFALPPGSRINLPGAGVVVESQNKGDFLDLPPDGAGRWPYIRTDEGKEIDLSRVPSTPTERLCYLTDVEAGWVAMESEKDLIGMSWDLISYPHMWFWQQIGGMGFPWYGRAAITALEPASTWPSYGLNTALTNGQAFHLQGRESRSTWVSLSMASGMGEMVEEVSSVNRDGTIHF